MRVPIAAALTAAIAFGAAPSLAAPTRDACVSASEDAQTFKLKGQLSAAREKLLVCSNDACPKVIRQDCSGWLDEVDRSMPTIVFSVHDASGSDLTDVRVSIDGTLLFEHLEGKAIPVDVGPHTIRFEVAGVPPKEERVVAREGEKRRIVTVTVGQAPSPRAVDSTPATPVAAGPTPDQRAPRSGPSPATWVIGGLGLASLAMAGIVGAYALNQRSSLYDRCGSTGTCAQSDVDGVYALYNVAYVGAAVGSALLVTSVVLFFATKPSKAASTALVVAPTLGGAALVGRF